MNTLLCRVSVLALCAVPFAASQLQAAACTPTSPTDGDTIICAGTGGGIVDASLDDLTITVTDTGRVEGGSDAAFEVKDDLSLTNDGTISSSGDHAIIVDDKAEIVNNGTIISTDGRGIDGDEEISVVNYGTITSTTDDAININEGSSVTNYGTITAFDQGVNVSDDSAVYNYGTITATGEGIETGDDATVVNDGTITSGDDAINVGERATVTNTGLLDVTGDQDGIDIDSGTILNTGTIIARGSEDGIDFDASTEATSTISNYGTIEGNFGINVEDGAHDPANTMSQVVLNYGTITGRGGIAMFLGAGDDTLEIFGGTINGAVDLGDGTDTLVVHSGATAGTLSFVSAPELVDMSDAPDTALFFGTTLAVAEPAVFAGMDALAGRFDATLADDVLRRDFTPGWWATGTILSREGDTGGQFAIGRDLGAVGVFIAHGAQDLDLSDDLHSVSANSTVIGLRSAMPVRISGAISGVSGGALTLGGLAYAGFGTSKVDSPTVMTGTGSSDTTVLGLAARLDYAAPTAAGTLTLSGEVGVARHSYDAYSVSGLGGARFGARDVTTSHVSLEAGLLRSLPGGAMLRPFIGAQILMSDAEDITMTLGTASARFATNGDDYVPLLSAGVDLAMNSALTARFEGQFDDHDAATALLSVALRF